MTRKELEGLARDAVGAAGSVAGGSNAVPALIVYLGLCQVAQALNDLREPLRSDHPLMGETFEGLTAALGSIADAISEKK
jgi:hypothetical protein